MEKRKQGRPKNNEIVNENVIKFGCFFDRDVHEKAMFMAGQLNIHLKTYVMKAVRNEVIRDAAIYLDKHDLIIKELEKEKEKELLTVSDMIKNIKKQING